MFNRRTLLINLATATIFTTHLWAAPAAVRVATYNASLYRDESGQLIRDLEAGDEQARRIAEVIQRVRPDVLLINEFDYDPTGRAASLFIENYLAVGQNGARAIDYPHHFAAPVNTGRPSERDLNKDGDTDDPADAIGYGRHEGQYGMLVLSRFSVYRGRVRTFQKFLWRDMPRALLPVDPRTGESYYDAEDLAVLRLSSKSFWDVPIEVAAPTQGGRPFVLHLLCSHPTPPVFDGPEDRNGRRNNDEIRLIADYISTDDKSQYLVDDSGRRGGLAPKARFVVLGDLNCDPVDGQGIAEAIVRLLEHPRVDASFTPTSRGGPLTVQQFADQHAAHRGDPAAVTSNFTAEGHGCLRIDYALPSRGLNVVGGGVYWPAPDEPGAAAAGASDHRLVYIDLRHSAQ